MRIVLTCLATMCGTAFTATVMSQTSPGAHRMPVVPAELLERPITLHTGIGVSHDSLSTSSPDAQRFYDQGLSYLHNYVWIDAARSFNHALRLDPPASCRFSFYLYNTIDEVERATDALADTVAGRARSRTMWERLRSWPRRRRFAPVQPSFDHFIHPATHFENGEPS